MKVYCTRIIREKGIALMRNAGLEVNQYDGEKEFVQQELIEICKHYDAVLNAGPNKYDENFFKTCPNIKAVSLHHVGYDNVDIAAANKYKIPIGHTPDVVSAATADVALLLILAVSRKAIYMNEEIKQGKWRFIKPTANLGFEIQNKTLGIFGLGRIGMDLARKCKAAFDMPIIYHNRSRNLEAEQLLGAKYVSFEELLQQSDVLSVHANLSSSTRNIFNKESFIKMKPSAIFINTARGGLHNEADLTDALEKGVIWGAGLDATNPEPMDKNSALLTLPNVCILPHIGTATMETRDAMAERAALNIIAALKGEKMPYVVNPEVYG